MIHEKSARESADERLEELEEQVGVLKAVISSDRNHAEEGVNDEMQDLAQKNMSLTTANATLEETISQLQTVIVQTQQQLQGSDDEKSQLQGKLDTLKKTLGGL